MPTPNQDILIAAASVDIQAAADDKKPARVAILAYSGQPFTLDGQQYILDLSGADVSGSIPLLADHENSLRSLVGSGEAVVRGNQLHVSGILSDATEAGRQVIALAKSGVSLQASVGYAAGKRERLQPGESTTVNGQTLKAAGNSITVVRSGKLRECSLVPIGADPGTQVHIAAKGGVTMNDTQDDTALELARERAAREEERIEQIRLAFRKFPDVQTVTLQDGKTIKASSYRTKAIREGTDFREVELLLMRADIPKGTPIHVHHDPLEPGNDSGLQTLEAALSLKLSNFSHEKHYKPEVLEAAKGLGIFHVLDACKAIVNRQGHHPKSKDELLRLGFSTHQFADLLSNLANKSLLDGYQSIPSAARLLCKKLNANDFKTHTGIRVTGDAKLTEVAHSGPISDGTLLDQSFTYRVKTYARLISVSREQLVNDDLGGLDVVPLMFGRGASLSIEAEWATLLLSNPSSFFSSGNANYQEGADTVLAAEGLRKAVALFRKQTDTMGEPIMVEPAFLLVPPELESTADALYVSTNLMVGTSTTEFLPEANPFKGKYKPVVSPYLSNSAYSGYSLVGWYLFGPANPIVPAMGIAYLSGQEVPIIEQKEPPPDTLGVIFRAYIDFGVCMIDHRGAVFSKGSA